MWRSNYARYLETLAVVKEGLGNESLTYQGEFYSFDDLPMRLRPIQDPHPPFWYMRNVETSAINGMHSIIVGNLGSFQANVERYFQLWDEHQGPGALNAQGEAPKIGLVNHLYLAETDQEAAEIAQPAWDQYKWNLAAPRRLRGRAARPHSVHGQRGQSQAVQPAGPGGPGRPNGHDAEEQRRSAGGARGTWGQRIQRRRRLP